MKSILLFFCIIPSFIFAQKCVKVESMLNLKQSIVVETTISKLKLQNFGQRQQEGNVSFPVFVSPQGDEYILKLQNKRPVFEKIDGYYIIP